VINSISNIKLLQSVAHKRINFNALGGSSLNIINGRQFQAILPYPASSTDVKVEEVRTAVLWILWDQAALASPDSESVNINTSLHRLERLGFQWNPWDHVPWAVRDRISSYQGSQIASGTYDSDAYRLPQQSIASSFYFPSTICIGGSGEVSGTQGTSISRQSQYVDWNSSFRHVGDLEFEDIGSGARYTGPPTLLEPPVLL
jgi:hypothetical protein